MPVISASDDLGVSWSDARLMRSDDDIVYVMNQRLIQISGGRLVLPVSGRDPRIPVETYGEGKHPCQARCLISDDDGDSWRWSESFLIEDTARGVQEPAVLETASGELAMLYRSGNGCHMASFSADGGDTWSAPERTRLTSACSPLTMLKLPDGRLLVCYNHAEPLFHESYFPRNPLAYSTSPDGHVWSEPLLIDDQPGHQLIYPSVTNTEGGLLVIYCSCYDPGDGRFSSPPPDAWKIGGGKRCLIDIS